MTRGNSVRSARVKWWSARPRKAFTRGASFGAVPNTLDVASRCRYDPAGRAGRGGWQLDRSLISRLAPVGGPALVPSSREPKHLTAERLQLSIPDSFGGSTVAWGEATSSFPASCPPRARDTTPLSCDVDASV